MSWRAIAVSGAQDGDIFNFDITLEKNGYIADSSKTHLVGEVNPAGKKLVRATYEAMWKGIRTVRPGAGLGWGISARQSSATPRATVTRC